MNNGPEKIDLTDEILLEDGRWVCAATYPQFDHARCYQWRKRPAPKHYPEADENGWIALSKRKPTKEDADAENHVLVAGDGLICIAHYEPVQEGLLEYATHWKPAGPGPVVETEEERQAKEDEAAYNEARAAWCSGGTPKSMSLFVWHAALAHARKERK